MDPASNSTNSDPDSGGQDDGRIFLQVMGFLFMLFISMTLIRHFCHTNSLCVAMDPCPNVWLCDAPHRNHNRQRAFTLLLDLQQLTTADGHLINGDLTDMVTTDFINPHRGHSSQDVFETAAVSSENVSCSDEENPQEVNSFPTNVSVAVNVSASVVNERAAVIEEQQHIQFINEPTDENPDAENSSNLINSNCIISQSLFTVNNISIRSTTYTSVYSSPQPSILKNRSIKIGAVSKDKDSFSQDEELPSSLPNIAITSSNDTPLQQSTLSNTSVPPVENLVEFVRDMLEDVIVRDPPASPSSLADMSDSSYETVIESVQQPTSQICTQSTEGINEDEPTTQRTVTVSVTCLNELVFSENDEPCQSDSTSIRIDIESDDTVPTITEVAQTIENHIVIDPTSVKVHDLHQIYINNDNPKVQEIDEERGLIDSDYQEYDLTSFDPAQPSTSQQTARGPSIKVFSRKLDLGFYEVHSVQSSYSDDYCGIKCTKCHNELSDCHCSVDSGNPDDEGFPKV